MPAARKRTNPSPPLPDHEEPDPQDILHEDPDLPTEEELEEDPPRPPRKIFPGIITTPIGAVSKNTQFALASEELNELQEAINSLRTKGGTIKLYRRGQNESGFRWLENIDAGSFSESTIGQVWGGGDYLAQFVDSEGHVLTRREFGVDWAVKGSRNASEGGHAPGITMADVMNLLREERVNKPPEKGEDAVMKLMQLGQQRSDEMMKLFLTMQMESSKATMNALTAMMSGRAPAEPQSKIMEVLMPLMLESFQQRNRTPENPLIKSIEDLKQVKDLLADGNDEKESTFDRLLTAAMPMLAQGMMQAGQGRVPGRNGPPRPVPQPLPAPTDIEQDPIVTTSPIQPTGVTMNPAPPADERADMINRLQTMIPLLVNAARNGTDQQTYVDLLMDTGSDAELEVIAGILKAPDWWQILFANHPETSEHSGWLGTLRDEILNAINENDQSPTEEHPTGPDSEHSAEP